MPARSTNRWDLLVPPETGRWSPSLDASVVVPYYDALPALRNALAALGSQTYPRQLWDVTIVDDGSPTPLDIEDVSDLGTFTVVNLEDEGFRLAAARNEGARSTDGEILVFLDGDMVPDPTWLESHLRWHHVAESALVIGFRDHIDNSWLDENVVRQAAESGGLAASVEGRQVERPEWIEFHMQRTRNLTSADTDLFRVVTGGNMSIDRNTFERVGGFDESFVRWGGEDTELGYRAWIAGALLIPEREAHCWHQGLGTTPDAEEREAQRHQAKRLAHLIPDPAMRKPEPGRIWLRPRIMARVGEGPDHLVAGTTAALLRCDDVGVIITNADSPDLREDFGPDPRVHFAGEQGPVSPFSLLRCEVPAGLAPTSESLERLAQTALHNGVAFSDGGIEVESARHVARRASASLRVPGRSKQLRQKSTRSRVIDRVKRVRSWSDAMSALRWLGAAARRRTGNVPTGHAPTPPLSSDPWARVLAPDLPSLPAAGSPNRRVDLVVVDQASEDRLDVPHLTLAERPDRELLAHPPLDADMALAVIQGETTPDSVLLQMLVGKMPTTVPPGNSTGRAAALLDHDGDADEATLEAVRRSVLREHLGIARLDQLRVAAGLGPALPRVSALLCTRRVEEAREVANVMSRQTYPYLELITVAHGVDPGPIESEVAASSVPHEIIEVSGDHPFGVALAIGTRAANGELIAKVDDDDLYAETHVEDLVLAWLLSHADIVGKAAEFVSLTGHGKVVRRFLGGAYSNSRTIAGGAMAVTRSALESVGGWRPVARHVDKALIEDITDAGGACFRTHALGYVLVRHQNHTWESDERTFLDQAEESWETLPGWVLTSPLTSQDAG